MKIGPLYSAGVPSTFLVSLLSIPQANTITFIVDRFIRVEYKFNDNWMNSQKTITRLLSVGQKCVFNVVVRIKRLALEFVWSLKLIRRILIGSHRYNCIIAGGKLTSSISEVLTASSRCGSYCDLSGELVPGQQCGPREVCCGSLRSRRCCTASSLEAAIVGLTDSVLSRDIGCPEIDEDDVDEDDRDPRGYPSTTVSSTGFETVVQWVFLISIYQLCKYHFVGFRYKTAQALIIANCRVTWLMTRE